MYVRFAFKKKSLLFTEIIVSGEPEQFYLQGASF